MVRRVCLCCSVAFTIETSADGATTLSRMNLSGYVGRDHI